MPQVTVIYLKMSSSKCIFLSQKNLLDRYPTNDMLFKMVKNGMDGTEGFPVGVQVIGRPWQEEMVIGAMKEIERLRDSKGFF